MQYVMVGPSHRAVTAHRSLKYCAHNLAIGGYFWAA